MESEWSSRRDVLQIERLFRRRGGRNVIEEEEAVTQGPKRRAFYGGDEHSRPSACARLASTGHWKASVAAAQ